MKNILLDIRVNKRFIARTVSVLIGLVAISGVIYYTYQYFSTRSNASAPIVKYSLKSGGCETKDGSATCTVTGNVGDLIPVDLTLTTQGETRMSGVDLILAFNMGTDGLLSYQNHTDTGFGTVAIEETHKREPVGRLLHLTLLADKSDEELPLSSVIRLNFKVEKPGTTHVMLITAASTIVGPQSTHVPYSLLPQNGLGSGEGDALLANVYNIKVVTDGTSTITPVISATGPITPTSGSSNNSPTPGGGNNGGGDDNDNDNQPANYKDVTLNIRLRFQGITSQPKNSSPIDVRVKLVEGSKAQSEYDTIKFTPQGDGAYVANHTFKNMNISAGHSFLIKGPKHIQKRICVNSPSENIPGTYKCDNSQITLKESGTSLDFTNIVLLSGDIPLQNGIVDAVDIAYIRNNIGESAPEVVARGDLNYDGIVDSQDYTLIINALRFKYDEGK